MHETAIDDMPASGAPQMPLLTRWRMMLLVSITAVLPFLFARIPPLIDVPGHIGRFAVQSAAPGDALLAYFTFHWAPALNLGGDLLVEGLRHLIGLMPAAWLVCAIVPVITTAGLLATMRAYNPRGSHAAPWALIFVYNIALLWGFLNYALAVGLALLGFAAWGMLEKRPRTRAVVYFFLPGVLMLVHGVGGILLPVLIASWELTRRGLHHRSAWNHASLQGFARAVWPLAGAALTLLLWKVLGPAGKGDTAWIIGRKLEAPIIMVRDQNIFLDLGTVLAAGLVLILGRKWGARFRNGNLGPVVVLALLFVLIPSRLLDTDRLDTRLAPLIPMLALALQDWSGVAMRRRRAVMISGALLLAFRFGLTTASFIDYDRSYTRELAALDHVRHGSRVLNLTLNQCSILAWRQPRLDHLSNLATPLRHAWVNSHWTVDGIHLLGVSYRPSPNFYRDPTHYIWPQSCIDPLRVTRRRRTLIELMPALPLAKVDYLWLIGDRLPQGYADPRLQRIWSSEHSELYEIRQPVPFRRSGP